MAPPLIKGFSDAERAALFAARDRAANGTPRLVRAAFLAAPIAAAVSGQRSAVSQSARPGTTGSDLPSPISNLPSLRSIVLSDWLALEELGHFAIVGGPHSLLDDAHLVYILAHDPPQVRAALANGRQPFSVTAVAYAEQFADDQIRLLSVLALSQLRLARSTVTCKPTGATDAFSRLPDKTSGIGWALTLADTFAQQYHWPHAAIWDEIPLVVLFAYYSAIKERLGVKASGPSYAEQDMIAAARAAAESSTPNPDPPQ